LLQGSIRENLDPHKEFTDDQVIETLKMVGMWEKVESLEHGLQSECSESNALFSMGEK